MSSAGRRVKRLGRKATITHEESATGRKASIRVKTVSGVLDRTPMLLSGRPLTRREAIRTIERQLRHSVRSAKACELISLFHIHPEELAEAGVSFEVLKALDPCFR